uniref:Uncharacterized protein n=1 Tax=Strongyloides stercoralis TaxID=6248 RepID=A0A0K0EIZ0_STRER
MWIQKEGNLSLYLNSDNENVLNFLMKKNSEMKKYINRIINDSIILLNPKEIRQSLFTSPIAYRLENTLEENIEISDLKNNEIIDILRANGSITYFDYIIKLG